MRAIKVGRMLALAALVLPGCNPSSFDSVLDHAPVVAFTPPGSSTSSLFVLPLPPPAEAGTTAAARMLVSRKDAPYLALADFDQNGKVTLSEVDNNLYGSSPVYSAAIRADGAILLGTPRAAVTNDTPGGRVYTLTFSPVAGGGYAFNVVGGVQGGGAVSRLGISVAAGNVTGLATGNFVVVGDNSVSVPDAVGSDGKMLQTTCPAVQLNSASDLYAFRPVAVGDVLAGGLDEIVLAGLGRVVFVQWNPTTNTLECSLYSLVVGTVASLAIADFDGDGNKDLAIGAPTDTVYVYLGPLNESTTRLVTIRNASASGFGQRVAAYQAPLHAAAQLLVADPAGTAGGRSGAGRVLLFDVTGALATLTDADAAAILFDSSTDADTGVFGSNLGGMLFNTGLCVPGGGPVLVPWASTNLDVLTFFNYTPAGSASAPADPRCFALKP